VSEDVVEVTMTQQDSFLPALLTWCTSTIYPKDFAGQPKEQFFEKPIGAGAFAVDSFSDLTGPAESIKLVPNEHFYGYGDGEPPLESLTLQTIADTSQRALQFRSGNVDIIEGVDSATEDQIGSDFVQRAKPDPIEMILVNTASGPLEDPNLRKAISLGVDREALAEALGDGSLPATGMLPINVPGATPPTEPYTYDPDAAKAALAESSSAGGVSLTYLYDAADKQLDTSAQILKDQLGQIGIELDLQTADNTTVQSRLSNGDFELSSFRATAISPTIFDPISFFEAVIYPWAGADVDVIGEQFRAGTATQDLAEQEAAARAVQDDAQEQNAVIGLYNAAYSWAVQDWVDGFAPLQYGYVYGEELSTK